MLRKQTIQSRYRSPAAEYAEPVRIFELISC
jgi:hypothetical protein